jgi:putative ABC transport system ATP-binding protein
LNLTIEQKAKMKEIGRNTRAQIEAVLTPEQKTKLQTLMAQRKAERQAQRQQGQGQRQERRERRGDIFDSLDLTETQKDQIKKIKELSKQFDHHPVLQNLNLRIEPGEFVAIVGRSGCGKTTLLTLIGALRSVQEGQLEVLGVPLRGANREQCRRVRERIGMIFQGHNLLRCLTAEQNVQMGADLLPDLGYGGRRAMAREWLRAVGLGDQLNKLPHDLSGGQKQRVAIARALAAHPKLLLADEPTAALDGRTGREVVELLQSLARDQGCGVLMVTHDPRILDVADRLIQMEDGQLQEVSLGNPSR